MKIRWIFQPFKDLPSPCIPRSKYSASGPFMHFENFKVNLQEIFKILFNSDLAKSRWKYEAGCDVCLQPQVLKKERKLKRTRREIWKLGFCSKNELIESNSLIGVPLSTQWDPSGYYYPTQVGIWWLFCILNHKKGVVCSLTNDFHLQIAQFALAHYSNYHNHYRDG